MEQSSPTASTSTEADWGISVRGAAKLAQTSSDAMDVDAVQSSSGVESPMGVRRPDENQSQRARKKRRGRNEGLEMTFLAVSSASAIIPQQRIESPSLLSRLQGKSPNTASPQASHNSGSISTSLAARLSPIANGGSNSSNTPTLAATTSDFARRVIPSPGPSDRDMLSSSSSKSTKSTANSHDHLLRRTSASVNVRPSWSAHSFCSAGQSEQGNIPLPAGQPRQRFIRGGISIKGTASLATDMSGSLDVEEDEFKIRGAAQRVKDDHLDGSNASQSVSLLARLENGGGGTAGKNGVGARGHRIRQ